jgi:copper chaperone
MQEILKIEGMHCGGCVRSVTNAIKRVDGVKDVAVSLEDEKATIELVGEETKLEEIRKAVEDAGYRIAA